MPLEEEIVLCSMLRSSEFGLLIGKEGLGGLASMPPAMETSRSSVSPLQPWAGRYEEP